MAINRANGGVIGVNNKTSGGGNTITTIKNSGVFNVQTGTNEVDVLVIAGGVGGGTDNGGGGGDGNHPSGGGGGGSGIVMIRYKFQ